MAPASLAHGGRDRKVATDKAATAPRRQKRHAVAVVNLHQGTAAAEESRQQRSGAEACGLHTSKAGSTGTCIAVTSPLVCIAIPITARSSPCAASVMPLARAAAVCEWTQ